MSTLEHVVCTDTTIDFFYSTSGQPYALSYNGTVYYYITNLQGDVMSIVDGTGAVVAEYEYDPYGNIVSATGELAEINPLRYRGYVYDQECNLYYLQSRYYDPSIGRFLNADSYASTGQGILGNNMFAYCGNEPVRHADPKGHAYYVLGIESGNMTTNSMLAHPGGGGGASITHVAASRKESIKVAKREKDFYNNTSERAVLDAEYFAFYKGVLYIKIPIGIDAFSFGVVFIGDQVKTRNDAMSVVQHEYGHSVHFSQIGVDNYLAYVAMPSLLGYWTKVPTEEYYSQPYEYVADRFGNVQRMHDGMPYQYSETTEKWWTAYWLFTAVAP